MAQTIPTQQNFPTSNQVPQNSIMDYFNKQTYLGCQFAVTTSQVIGASETNILLIQNSSTKKSTFINRKTISSLTASNSAILRSYLTPTFSLAGTAATITSMRPANTTITPLTTVTTSPTTSVNGTLVDVIATTPFATMYSSQLFIIDPGQTMLITLQASAATTTIASQLAWYEL
jgi:hypothetical protein